MVINVNYFNKKVNNFLEEKLPFYIILFTKTFIIAKYILTLFVYYSFYLKIDKFNQ